MERSEDVAKLVALAHQKGLKVMWKPQLWVPRGYPGDLHFERPAERAEWFAEYGHFLRHHAEYAQRSGADVLCIGVELSKLSRYTAEWRKLIAGTRAVFKGLLTYGAAQGEDFEGVAFWDDLDFIGLSEYYPLPDNLDTTQVVRRIEAVQRRWSKPVVFVEAGFAAARGTPSARPGKTRLRRRRRRRRPAATRRCCGPSTASLGSPESIGGKWARTAAPAPIRPGACPQWTSSSGGTRAGADPETRRNGEFGRYNFSARNYDAWAGSCASKYSHARRMSPDSARG